MAAEESVKGQKGYKEWLGVCALMGAGETSLLLRKGGIHEGRDGFSFAEERFFLFPTGFHEADGQLTRGVPEAPVGAAEAEGGVGIWLWMELEWARLVTDFRVVEALAPYHCWTPEVVAARFSYRAGLEADCLSVAFGRVYRMAEPWTFPYERRFGGCRSWVDLPEPPLGWRDGLEPVIGDDVHRARAGEIAALMGGAALGLR